MFTVKHTTAFTPIKEDQTVIPKAPMFYFQNDGNTAVRVNEKVLMPGEKFGIDNSNFIATFWAAGKQLNLMTGNSYKISFASAIVGTASSIQAEAVPPPVPVAIKLLTMVETFFEHIK